MRRPTAVIENLRTPHATAAARFSIARDVEIELVRKSIHVSIAFVPFVAGVIGVAPTLSLLAFGTVFYAYAETLRLAGRSVYIVSGLTMSASRTRDLGGFVLGPVTLGIGAMAALLLYPDPAARIAIFALAFGDGFASLIGRAFGTIRIPGGKTLEGSLACFVAVLIPTYTITARPMHAVAIALAATLFEITPLKDIDNIVLPVGTGLVAYLLLL